MCGIFGFHKLDKFKADSLSIDKLRIAINYLAIQNQSRGKDSTGLAVINDSGESMIIRKVRTATDYIKHKKVNEKLGWSLGVNTRTVLGHTRMATTGQVNLVNAQPFHYGDIIGTHNGIVTNWKELEHRHNLNYQTTCDSESIFALASKGNTLADQAKLISDIEGYMAIAYTDARKPGYLMLGVASNQVSLYVNKSEGFLFWSSEEEPLLDLFEILNLDMEEIKVKEDTLYSINGKGKVEEAKLDIDDRFSYSNYGAYARGGYASYCEYTYLPSQQKPVRTPNTVDRCEMCFTTSSRVKYNSSFGGFLCKKCKRIANKWYSKSNNVTIEDVIDEYDTLEEKLAKGGLTPEEEKKFKWLRYQIVKETGVSEREDAKPNIDVSYD